MRADSVGLPMFIPSTSISSALGQKDRPLDGVFQFANVSRPFVGTHGAFGGRREEHAAAATASAFAQHEVPRKGHDVLCSLTQRGQTHLHRIQAIEQVSPKSVAPDRGIHIRVGHGDNANIHPVRTGRAGSLELTFFKDTQKLYLLG